MKITSISKVDLTKLKYPKRYVLQKLKMAGFDIKKSYSEGLDQATDRIFYWQED